MNGKIKQRLKDIYTNLTHSGMKYVLMHETDESKLETITKEFNDNKLKYPDYIKLMRAKSKYAREYIHGLMKKKYGRKR